MDNLKNTNKELFSDLNLLINFFDKYNYFYSQNDNTIKTKNKALIIEYQSRLAFFEILQNNPYGDGTKLDNVKPYEIGAELLAYMCEKINNRRGEISNYVWSDNHWADCCENIYYQFAELKPSHLIFMAKVWDLASEYAAIDPDKMGAEKILKEIVDAIVD